MTPLLRPVCSLPTAGWRSRTAIEASGTARCQLAGHREPQDAATDDGDVASPGASGTQPACCCGTPRSSSSRSESTISWTISSKLVRGSQPSFSRALDESPTRCSTSAGRRKRGSMPHVRLGVEADVPERQLHELADAVRLAGGDHEVVRLVLLEHQPHRLDVVPGVAPVALRVEVAERQLALKPELDRGGAVGDLASHELEAATLALVVEEDSRARRTGRSSRGS